MENELTTTIYFIISCQADIDLYEDDIEIFQETVEILEKEILRIKEMNMKYSEVEELNDSFRGKNIYLCKLKLRIAYYKQDISIKLNMLESD